MADTINAPSGAFICFMDVIDLEHVYKIGEQFFLVLKDLFRMPLDGDDLLSFKSFDQPIITVS